MVFFVQIVKIMFDSLLFHRFPLVPNATPDNNRFVANICNMKNWPVFSVSRKFLLNF